MTITADGRVAIVAGGGAAGEGIGNGRAAALLMAREGAQVVVVDRNGADGERTAEMIMSEGGRASTITADVTSAEDCRQVVEHAVETHGGIDVLVNNVGVGSQGSVVETEEAAWNRVMRINVNSAFLMAQAAVPHLSLIHI